MAPPEQEKDEEFDGFDITSLRNNKKKAELGYLSMPLYEPLEGAHWGQFNDRPLVSRAVKDLVNSFKLNIDNCTEKTTIDVVVRKSWLKEDISFHTSVEGLRIHDINNLVFTEEGALAAIKEQLWVLGGNHRREAVKEYVESKKKEKQSIIKGLEAKAKNKTDKGSEGEPADESQWQDDEEAVRTIARLDANIAKGSRWAIRVYDRGE